MVHRRIPKSVKNHKKSISGPQGAILDVPGHPLVANWCQNGAKMESLGLQNDRFGYSKSHQSHQSHKPASPTIYQLHCNYQGAGGRGQRP